MRASANLLLQILNLTKQLRLLISSNRIHMNRIQLLINQILKWIISKIAQILDFNILNQMKTQEMIKTLTHSIQLKTHILTNNRINTIMLIKTNQFTMQHQVVRKQKKFLITLETYSIEIFRTKIQHKKEKDHLWCTNQV